MVTATLLWLRSVIDKESFEVNSEVVFWDLKRKDAFALARQFACVF
jgi:hypothetical protein